MSLIGTRGLERWARAVYEQAGIEDLWLDFFCITCNLTTSGQQVLDAGPVWRAVRASAALPGIFLPVLHEGHVLVDGAVVNNLPGDVARDRGCHTVVVADVSPEDAFRYEIDRFPSPWGYFLNLLAPRSRRRRIPGIVSTRMRLPAVSSADRARRSMAEADLCLKPPVARSPGAGSVTRAARARRPCRSRCPRCRRSPTRRGCS